MIEQWAKEFTSMLLKRKLIPSYQKKSYQYGYELLFSIIINICILLILGIFFNRLISTIIFIFVFTSLKRYTGGLHMPDYKSCIITFTILYFTILSIDVIFSLTAYHIDNSIFFPVLTAICCIFTFVLAPVPDKNKHLTTAERKKIKIKSKIIVSIYFVLFALSDFNQCPWQITGYIGYALILIALLLVAGLLKNLYLNDSTKKYRGETYD